MNSDDLVAAARDAERYCRTFIEGTFDRTQEARARMALDDLRAALTATPEPGLPLDRCGEPTCVHGVHEDMTCSSCGRFPLAAKPEPGLTARLLQLDLDTDRDRELVRLAALNSASNPYPTSEPLTAKPEPGLDNRCWFCGHRPSDDPS